MKAEIGTFLEIRNLRDVWSEKQAILLGDYLNRTYNDNKMQINLYFKEKRINICNIFDDPKIGINYSTKIKLNYISDVMKLFCTIENDEFDDSAQLHCNNNIHNYSEEIDLKIELENENQYSDFNIENILKNLGDFSAELYFSLRNVVKEDMQKFLYKRRVLEDKYKEGIVLYRNAFSISSYEGDRDWLNFEKRSRKSPAAATHKTGQWRVRYNQISGKVLIDKQENFNLKDLSNRQGMEEDIYYNIFINILNVGISIFEKYRQSIIRDINKKNEKLTKKNVDLVEKIIINPSLNDLTKSQRNELIKDLKDLKIEYKAEIEQLKKIEIERRYDVRLLNVLSTIGLRAASIAHEMRNDRNSITNNYRYIVDALKEYKVWDVLNEPENKKIGFKNVPALLQQNKEVSIKIIQFMDLFLSKVKKKKFVIQDNDIDSLINEIKDNWEQEYKRVEIILNIKVKKFKISSDIISVILDNLILNSLQQNESVTDLKINIDVQLNDSYLYISYYDNGIGLSEKYLSNPFRILDPHETTRTDGHGLGMWIVHNTILNTGGKVMNITSNNGFGISFKIGSDIK